MLPTLMRHVFMEIHVLNNMQVHAQQVGFVVLNFRKLIYTLGRKALPLFRGALADLPLLGWLEELLRRCCCAGQRCTRQHGGLRPAGVSCCAAVGTGRLHPCPVCQRVLLPALLCWPMTLFQTIAEVSVT